MAYTGWHKRMWDQYKIMGADVVYTLYFLWSMMGEKNQWIKLYN